MNETRRAAGASHTALATKKFGVHTRCLLPPMTVQIHASYPYHKKVSKSLWQLFHSQIAYELNRNGMVGIQCKDLLSLNNRKAKTPQYHFYISLVWTHYISFRKSFKPPIIRSWSFFDKTASGRIMRHLT